MQDGGRYRISTENGIDSSPQEREVVKTLLFGGGE